MSAFLPTATVLLVLLGAQQSAVSISDFRAADHAAKIRILNGIPTARVNIAIGQVIELVRAGLHDSSADVQMSALGALMGRAMAARWAGTSGPGMGPSATPSPDPPMIPAEWKGDQQALRDALEDDCVALLNGDSDDRVRYQALLAVGNLEMSVQPDRPLPEWFVALLVDLYRHDPSPRIRAEAVKTFRLVPNDTPETRAVLRDALVDPNATIRHEGLAGITPAATAASFNQARDTVLTALQSGNPDVRLGAVQALNAFGALAAPYIETLERLSTIDPDAQVRASARLAIEAIQWALRGRGPS